MSAAARCCSSCSKGTAVPLTRRASLSAAAAVRFATSTRPAPREAKCTATSAPVSPAPTTSTVAVPSAPYSRCASSTAAELTLTGRWAMAVSVRTRLPTSIARRKSLLSTALVQPAAWACRYAALTCERI